MDILKSLFRNFEVSSYNALELSQSKVICCDGMTTLYNVSDMQGAMQSVDDSKDWRYLPGTDGGEVG
jgi:hypothetical protein